MANENRHLFFIQGLAPVRQAIFEYLVHYHGKINLNVVMIFESDMSEVVCRNERGNHSSVNLRTQQVFRLWTYVKS